MSDFNENIAIGNDDNSFHSKPESKKGSRGNRQETFVGVKTPVNNDPAFSTFGSKFRIGTATNKNSASRDVQNFTAAT